MTPLVLTPQQLQPRNRYAQWRNPTKRQEVPDWPPRLSKTILTRTDAKTKLKSNWLTDSRADGQTWTNNNFFGLITSWRKRWPTRKEEMKKNQVFKGFKGAIQKHSFLLKWLKKKLLQPNAMAERKTFPRLENKTKKRKDWNLGKIRPDWIEAWKEKRRRKKKSLRITSGSNYSGWWCRFQIF